MLSAHCLVELKSAFSVFFMVGGAYGLRYQVLHQANSKLELFLVVIGTYILL